MKKPKVTISYPGAMLNIMVKVSLGLLAGLPSGLGFHTTTGTDVGKGSWWLSLACSPSWAPTTLPAPQPDALWGPCARKSLQ